ncbi:cleavage and polyadenylation specificity factor subunit 6-like [Parasteatoda tepidariorum]|uniref:cleavage and polyadenylation specificity factor subunit 6-like n=1 Tax=Parasteatoda tepidariorum TaxID=114398 RepID=UPI001C7193AD|nr:cleavage and polyadenylation specificity factor subunit 6-like [Parasteatoda tepidariorum]
MSDLDLYDDLDEQNEDENREDSNIDERKNKSRSNSFSNFASRQSRCAVYIGNLTWWTTDLNLIEAMKSLEINDVEEVKFFENKGNGQSKGFCIVTLGSENSRVIALDKLPEKEIHGQRPVVTICTKQNLFYFESQSKKEGHGGSNRSEKFKDRRTKEYDSDFRDNNNRPMHYNKSRLWNNRNENYPRQQHGSNMQSSFQTTPVSNTQPGYTPWPPTSQVQMPPTIYAGPPPVTTGGMSIALPRLPIPPNIRLLPPKGTLPPMGPRILPPPDIRGPPPPPGVPQNTNMPHLAGPRVPTSGQGLPSISPSVMPGSPFYHPQSISSGLPPATKPPDMYNRSLSDRGAQYPDNQYHSNSDNRCKEISVSEAEFEEIMSRNRSVSSNAISRAISDASSGDYANAVETLVTAISLIKQSKIGNDERCKILTNSLQDTLHGIESKLYRSRSKDRSNSRERDRSRERTSRREKSSRRDRSRSRDREYRERSRERDRYHEDRYRDKDRDHRSSRR